MYIGMTVFFRLLFLPLLYVLTVFLLWHDLGIFVLLFAVFPLVANICVFSYPMLNYFSLLGCSLLILYVMNVPLPPLMYNSTFLGIQFLLLSITIFLAIIKMRQMPFRKNKKQKQINKLISENDSMIVHIDPILQTIKSITPTACRLYGWGKKQLTNKSIDMIYSTNILESPPDTFWETLRNGNIWHGFADIITRDNTICEERAYYTGIKNAKDQIVLIEKKIIDVFIKDKVLNRFDEFHQFYEENPTPMAVINNSHYIENGNPEFLKSILIKPIFNKTKFHHLFEEDIQEKIICALNNCFEGNKNSIHEVFCGLEGNGEAEYIFSPYHHHKYKKVTHVLFMLKMKDHAKIHAEKSLEFTNDTSKVLTPKTEIMNVLRQSLTELYQKNSHFPVKLFSLTIPSILVDREIWGKMIIKILLFIESEELCMQKKAVISCFTSSFYDIFQISFLGIKYSHLTEIIKKEKMESLLNQIKLISDDIKFIQGKDQELILLFSFNNTENNTIEDKFS